MSSAQLPLSICDVPMIGVVGGGQLAQMLVEAARVRRIGVAVQTGSIDDPAAKQASRLVLGDPSDVEATKDLVKGCEGITFENEWVNVESLLQIEQQGVKFHPPLMSLDPLVNKLKQRRLLDELGMACPDWVPLESIDLIEPSLPDHWEFPLMAKATYGGYDGKGTRVIHSIEELCQLIESVDPSGWLLEAWVSYDCELALVVSRDRKGLLRTFPLVETHQSQQVCNWVLAPAGVGQDVEAMAYNMAASLLTKLSYVGVLAIEFFYGPAGLQVNEIAPRTHNSGHFTIEACNSSQFDQQLCISAGLPVPSTDFMVAGALMVNLLGLAEGSKLTLEQRLDALRQCDEVHLHWYGKCPEVRGRKMGHVTILLKGLDIASRKQEAKMALDRIRSIWPLPDAEMD